MFSYFKLGFHHLFQKICFSIIFNSLLIMSTEPSFSPSNNPSKVISTSPSDILSFEPSIVPHTKPSIYPSMIPSKVPSNRKSTCLLYITFQRKYYKIKTLLILPSPNTVKRTVFHSK